MRKFIIFEDGHEQELTPITYGEWFIISEERSCGDYWQDFDYWLRVHGLEELASFECIDNDNCCEKYPEVHEFFDDCKIEVREGDRNLVFDLDYWGKPVINIP